MKHTHILPIAAIMAMTVLPMGCIKDNEEEPRVPISEIIIDSGTVNMEKGDTICLGYTVIPENAAIDGDPLWESSNEDIATVDRYGNVIAVEKGRCFIKISLDGKTAQCTTYVTGVAIKNVTVAPGSANLYIGEEIQLTATVFPEDAEYNEIIWFSTNEYVAMVDNGKVLAMSPGTTVIQAFAKGVMGICTINVNGIEVEEISLNIQELEMSVGDTFQLETYVLPQNANPEISFESSAPGTVSVNAEGLVTAVSTGHATVTATAGGRSASCEITVIPGSQPKTGDYYYSDGTYSTEFDPEKIPIGIVFHVTDPTKDDPFLGKTHPDCTNGLVISLYTAGKSPWQSNYTNYNGSINDWISENTEGFLPISSEADDGIMEKAAGFNNTEAILQFNAAAENSEWISEAIKMSGDFTTYSYPPAPSGSSGWYLPSIKELSILCYGVSETGKYSTENGDFINGRIGSLPPEYGAQTLNETYWSSTEKDGENAYDFHFKEPYGSSYALKNEKKSIRCILAF